jgi:hypothetical protein
MRERILSMQVKTCRASVMMSHMIIKKTQPPPTVWKGTSMMMVGKSVNSLLIQGIGGGRIRKTVPGSNGNNWQDT